MPVGSCEAAVQPAPLLARIPDGEGGPVGQGPLLQEVHAVGPDGRPGAQEKAAGAGSCHRLPTPDPGPVEATGLVNPQVKIALPLCLSRT